MFYKNIINGVIKELKSLIKQDGTYCIYLKSRQKWYTKKVEHSKGYYVAYKPLDEINTNDFGVLVNGDCYIGLWGDEYDLSYHINNLNEAIVIALKYNQKAIWDIKNNKEIWLQDIK